MNILVYILLFIIGAIVWLEWRSTRWLHLSFTCPVCQVAHSRFFFFNLDVSHFQCPFCRRRYILEKKGNKCRFERQPLDEPTLPVVLPFEVFIDWDVAQNDQH